MPSDRTVHRRFRSLVPDTLPVRRLTIFLAITFSVNWLPAAYFFIEGITFGNRNLSALGYNAVLVIVSFSPAIGVLVTRWLTGEGLSRDQLLLPVDIWAHWREYVTVAVVPLVITILGVLLYFSVFPTHLATNPLATLASKVGVGPEYAAAVPAIVFLGTIVALVPGAIMVLGEELGWRAYLLPKLALLGPRSAAIVTGVIWGVWHWPYVLLGLNFGLEYPGSPWLGLLAMVWVPTLYGVLLAWATLRTGSVWPAALGHAAFNTSARWGPMVADATPNLALGPTTGGLVASAGWILVAGWLLTQSDVFTGDSRTNSDHIEGT